MTVRMTAAPPRPGTAARTRSRSALLLWGLVVVGNLVGLMGSYTIALRIRGGGVAPTSHESWLLVYWALVAVAAVVDGLWIDELAMGGAFRKAMRKGLGRANEKVDPDQADLDAVAALRHPERSFPIILMLCGVATHFLFAAVNHGFISWYRDIGEHIATLQRDDPGLEDKRRAAVIALSRKQTVEATQALIDVIKRRDDAALWAAWALGRRNDDAHARHYIAPLASLLDSDDKALRREALVALGRLQHRPIAEEITAEIERSKKEDATLDIRLVWVLGYLQVVDTLPTLKTLVYDVDPQVSAVAAWAVAQLGEQRGGRVAVDLLHERLSTAPAALRCTIVHSLGVLRDERSNLEIIRAYERSTPEERSTPCEKLSIDARPDGAGEEYDLIRAESLGLKTIKSLANMAPSDPSIRAEVIAWIAETEADPTTARVLVEPLASLREGLIKVGAAAP